jgi:hypothetical protein
MLSSVIDAFGVPIRIEAVCGMVWVAIDTSST